MLCHNEISVMSRKIKISLRQKRFVVSTKTQLGGISCCLDAKSVFLNTTKNCHGNNSLDESNLFQCSCLQDSKPHSLFLPSILLNS